MSEGFLKQAKTRKPMVTYSLVWLNLEIMAPPAFLLTLVSMEKQKREWSGQFNFINFTRYYYYYGAMYI